MLVELSDDRIAALRRAIENERGDWAYQVCVDLARDIYAAERDPATHTNYNTGEPCFCDQPADNGSVTVNNELAVTTYNFATHSSTSGVVHPHNTGNK